MDHHPPSPDTRWLRASLVTVWLFTALASAIGFHGQSTALLQQSGITHGGLQAALIGGGIAADLAVGLALWLRPGRASYGAALLLMAAMTAAATLLQPALWLHPLGPLLKNLPIAALLVHLLRQEEKTAS